MTNELVKRPLIKKIRKVFLSNWRLYVLLLPALLWLFVFRYTPMYGLTLAFKDFSIRKGILDSPWVGLKYFRQFFSTSIAWTLVKNTLILSLESLAFVFPIPIIFALFLNQLRYSKFKKIVQTISFAPYFISNVVVISIMTVILAPGNGFVNVFLQSLGCEPLMLMTKPEYFRPMYIISEIWQTMGFNAIVYIAALTGVSPDLHEAGNCRRSKQAAADFLYRYTDDHADNHYHAHHDGRQYHDGRLRKGLSDAERYEYVRQ